MGGVMIILKKQWSRNVSDQINNTLKSCPFCGLPAEIDEDGHFYISCSQNIIGECGGRMDGQPTLEEAIKKWNTRNG